MNERLKILIADDQELFAEGLRVLIESLAPEFEVVGIAENGRQAIVLAEQYRPDIVLMDIRMPEMNGVEATKAIDERYPGTKVLVLTTFSDDEYVEESLKCGAVGYLLKSRRPAELVNSIRALASGIVQIDPDISAKLFSMDSKRRYEDAQIWRNLSALSRREKDVLRLLAQAEPIAAVARKLDIAEQTVRNHVNNIYAKLDVHSRLEIMKLYDPIREFLKSVG